MNRQESELNKPVPTQQSQDIDDTLNIPIDYKLIASLIIVRDELEKIGQKELWVYDYRINESSDAWLDVEAHNVIVTEEYSDKIKQINNQIKELLGL